MLSNFSAHAVEFEGRDYPTAEHAYQAQKFAHLENVEIIRIARSPLLAKRRAKILVEFRRRDWSNEFKLYIMEKILRAKVEQHADVRDALLRSGNMEIVENSPTDSFWGWGPDKKGQNHLGKIWMKIRDEIQLQDISDVS